MTTIIGVEHNDKVFMGADSEGIVGWSRNTLTNRKIVRFSTLLIGVAGELRTVNLIQHYFEPPFQPHDETDEHYVTVSVIGAIRQCFKDNGWLRVENSKEERQGSAFLIGHHSKLYRVGSDFDVARYEVGIASIGSGSDYALGAMFALRAGRKPSYSEAQVQDQIKKALRVSAQLSMGVSEPFYVESI